MYWLGLALGCTALAMVQHLVGGKWGATIRRFLESGASTMPVMLALFVPILFGIPALYEWSHEEVMATDAILQRKELYLNVPFFIGRALVYFAVWIVLAYLLNRWSTAQDDSGDIQFLGKLRKLSAGGLVLYMLTMTFAGFDWGMSLEPHWYLDYLQRDPDHRSGPTAFALCAITMALSARKGVIGLEKDHPAISRCGELHARFHDVMDVHVVEPVHDHLFGQLA